MSKRKEDTYDRVISFIVKELLIKNNEIDVHTTFEKVGLTGDNKVSIIEKISETFAITRSHIKMNHSEKIVDFIDYIHHLRHK